MDFPFQEYKLNLLHLYIFVCALHLRENTVLIFCIWLCMDENNNNINTFNLFVFISVQFLKMVRYMRRDDGKSHLTWALELCPQIPILEQAGHGGLWFLNGYIKILLAFAFDSVFECPWTVCKMWCASS